MVQKKKEPFSKKSNFLIQKRTQHNCYKKIYGNSIRVAHKNQIRLRFEYKEENDEKISTVTSNIDSAKQKRNLPLKNKQSEDERDNMILKPLKNSRCMKTAPDYDIGQNLPEKEIPYGEI